jgi:predicted Zn-dependent peptidase
MMRGGGPFTASGSVVTAKTDSALKEFFYEMDRMHAEGITPAELDFALKGISGSFALGFETPSQVATSLRTVYLYGLPEEYYRTYVANFTRVTLDDVKAMAKKYLDTASMAVVVVGDVKAVRPGIEAMKFGEVVVVDTEGRRVE